ncbi:hypothetical protein [Bacillus sp. 2205SS5-2]|uniref:hypothetical protein n=1 Tax=Bacillus sp. 2205SS5-2 TaxID=3109031 RepID=UPI00300580D4
MKFTHGVRVFVVLILLTTYFFGFSQLGVFALDNLLSEDGFTNNTTIGSIDVSNFTVEEADQLLQIEVEDWLKEQKNELEYNEEQFPFPAELFSFNLATSVQSAQSGQENSLRASINESALSEWLNASYSISLENVNVNLILQEIELIASTLTNGKTLSLNEYLISEELGEYVSEAISAEVDVTPDVVQLVEALSPIHLPGQTSFSFNDYVKNSGISSQDYETMGLISSLIYELTLQTNFQIIERNTSKQLPASIDLGYEAKVQPELNLDFSLANPNEALYVIKLEILGNKLYGRLEGKPLPATYSVLLQGKETFSPKTIIQYSPKITTGNVEVQFEGKDGVLIEVIKKIVNSSGEVTGTVQIAEDFYPPQHRIEVHSLVVPESAATQSGQKKGDDSSGPTSDEEDKVKDSTVPPETVGGTGEDAKKIGESTKTKKSSEEPSQDENSLK